MRVKLCVSWHAWCFALQSCQDYNSCHLSVVVVGYLCKPEDNIYNIDFVRFKIRDLETGTVLFEIAKPPQPGTVNCFTPASMGCEGSGSEELKLNVMLEWCMLGLCCFQRMRRKTGRQMPARDDLYATSLLQPSCDWGLWELREWLKHLIIIAWSLTVITSVRPAIPPCPPTGWSSQWETGL